ncbi:hypothetical protein NUW58_g3582 [Xylaria curta]|uniref:Uncharacterized protein n=1 Tax=Xylaria curta TaxID=42375 RepID=A0ACC1PD10_9PEZI|nr:hypothetical protein NUW58_g3582 [Xylaria curta]
MQTAADDVSTKSSPNTSSPDDTSASSIKQGPRLNPNAMVKGCLDPGLIFDNAARDAIQRPKSIFLTDATGFVGAFSRGSFSSYVLWESGYMPLLRVVVGDITQGFFGLSEDAYYDLADHIEAICHSGALVNWARPLEDFIGPNIVSVHEVLRLASYGRNKPVHFISTASTLPLHRGYEVTEQEKEYGYATSKYDPGDFLQNLISGGLEIGVFPSLDADLSSVLPVDYISKTIVAVMTSDLGRIGKDYDFANPHALTFNRLFKMMGSVGVYAGAGQCIEPFWRWRKRVLEYAAEYRTSPLARMSDLIDDIIDTEGAPWSHACQRRTRIWRRCISCASD